mgnify:CR=1 FL=1
MRMRIYLYYEIIFIYICCFTSKLTDPLGLLEIFHCGLKKAILSNKYRIYVISKPQLEKYAMMHWTTQTTQTIT